MKDIFHYHTPITEIPVELAAFLQNAGSICAAVYCNGRIVTANDQFAAIFGYTNSEDLVSRPIDSLFESDEQSLAAGCVINCNRSNKTVFLAHINAAPWASAPQFTLLIVSRITEQELKDGASANTEIEERYRNLVEQAADGIFVADDRGRYMDVNPSGCAALGYTREELLELGPVDITIPQERPKLLEEIGRIYNGARSFREWTVMRKDGTTFPAEVSARLLSDGRLLGILRDKTEQKEALMRAQASEELLREYIKNTPAAVAMFDQNMRYLLHSKRWIKDYKLDIPDLTGMLHYDVFPEALVWKEVHDRCLQGATEQCDKDQFPRHDGSVDWIRWRICPWYDGSGEIGGIILSTEVITDKIQALDALQLSEERLRTLVTNVPSAIFRWLAKPKATTTFISDGIYELTGYPASDFIHEAVRTSADIIHPEDYGEVKRIAWEAVDNISSYAMEYRIINAGGEIRWMQENAQVLKDADTGNVWVDGAIFDVTKQKAAEAALLNAHEELERAYRLQKEFLNNVTHEVRTPLTAVMGYVEMLLDGLCGPLTDEQNGLLQRVMNSSEHLLDIVSSVLELSRLKSGTPALHPKLCSPSVVINSALSSVMPQSEKKSLNISVNLPKRDYSGFYDEEKLFIILNNLLSNAVKFTHTGGINVAVESNKAGFQVIVVDSGIGISEEDLVAIFDEFKQVDHSRKHKPDGFGIGLAIVAAMVDLMGASLTVSSAKGMGTAFYLQVPMLEN